MTTQADAASTPSADDLVDKLRAVVIEVLKLEIPPQELAGNTNLYELGLESLNVVVLLSALEKAFDIVIDVEDLSADLFGRWDDLVAFVRGKVDAR
ncbi:phosphopantetheine-binding protein [Myxococcus sp. K15C18031901]|uniref:phosphopantetheine-binding protein n=1 Tax=Myxococcus dinghuensis TaxID=2906761 RepID=UPI0020A6F754|nr:phosphopantetheine-binding protein [Myxococcus dinghuensis]MCP3102885.1 phosphopantetheine-binding protein [Myxococcus dinghuensis]